MENQGNHGKKRGHSVTPERTDAPNKRKKSVSNEELANLIISRTQTLQDTLEAVNGKLVNLDTRTSALETSAKAHDSEIASLRRENAFLRDELRRSNLLIHGLPESQNEKPEELLDAVQHLLLDTLEVSVKIDEMFRLGIPRPGKTRPIKVKFPLLSDRNIVFMARKKILGSNHNMYISEDLDLSTRLARQKAYEMKKSKSKPRSMEEEAA